MTNPFLKRGERKAKQSNAYWNSSKQEKRIAKKLGGNRVIGSGNKIRKGDICVSGIARIEAKSTERASFSITKDMIEKITHAGLASDEVPAIIVEFIDEYGKKLHEVAVIPIRFLESLILCQNK